MGRFRTRREDRGRCDGGKRVFGITSNPQVAKAWSAGDRHYVIPVEVDGDWPSDKELPAVKWP